LHDLIKRDEVPLSVWFKNKFGNGNKVGIMLYTLVLYFTSFIIFTLIGCFYFSNGPYEGIDYYGPIVIKLYNFCDLISNWTSLIVFVGLGAAILGGLVKKYRRQMHQTSKWFNIMAIIGIVLITLSLLYEFTNTFYDLCSSISFTNAHNISISQFVVPAILQLTLLIIFTLIIALSGLNKKQLKK
jgi:hypothetical protein